MAGPNDKKPKKPILKAPRSKTSDPKEISFNETVTDISDELERRAEALASATAQQEAFAHQQAFAEQAEGPETNIDVLEPEGSAVSDDEQDEDDMAIEEWPAKKIDSLKNAVQEGGAGATAAMAELKQWKEKIKADVKDALSVETIVNTAKNERISPDEPAPVKEDNFSGSLKPKPAGDPTQPKKSVGLSPEQLKAMQEAARQQAAASSSAPPGRFQPMGARRASVAPRSFTPAFVDNSVRTLPTQKPVEVPAAQDTYEAPPSGPRKARHRPAQALTAAELKEIISGGSTEQADKKVDGNSAPTTPTTTKPGL